ncbi:MAG TPA: pyridoxamine 5'-phosphate oxidase [Bacteroidia bacterium]|nr:pyridoxamine 5'-phosphate oxidase [Bacteroidota bacterium]MBP6656843.1 pyridoxamine 5'-phosphate oxidase [Bacteroidia bacterium]MBK7430544.1 pyridoxamine 5'-phosphate oxidase [Bacteroidota bacterium]MBK8584927.1 pyridoxamine 5'-phosphate oxidase [Bacteroidota bacterium]MBP9789160.1 pyridoxamine 5'-phosphate oxidase [Bacteroidia bacterium]
MKKLKDEIFNLRVDFAIGSLDEKMISSDPFRQFNKWMENALAAKVLEPTAMTLSTATKKGIVGSRIVLLRDLDKKGFNFFTNYNSAKGREMKENKNVSLNFFWPELQRQVRITGVIEKLPEKASEKYFASRPRESQIGAWASNQSEVLTNRQELESRVEKLFIEFDGKKVPRPKHWGGYRVKPTQIEFWQGRQSRLHDRFLFKKSRTGKWTMSRLNP